MVIIKVIVTTILLDNDNSKNGKISIKFIANLFSGISQKAQYISMECKLKFKISNSYIKVCKKSQPIIFGL